MEFIVKNEGLLKMEMAFKNGDGSKMENGIRKTIDVKILWGSLCESEYSMIFRLRNSISLRRDFGEILEVGRSVADFPLFVLKMLFK